MQLPPTVEMILPELAAAAGIAERAAEPLPSVPVRGICYDSRKVQPGFLFVAVRGTSTDGHLFVEQSLAAGACAAVVENAATASRIGPCIVVPSTRAALADLAAAWHGYPARSLFVTGITGTDGKTTSSFLLSHVLEALGLSTGLMSTVAIKIGPQWRENRARQSTLESLEIQQTLAAMRDAAVSDAVVEATSHGLALERVRRCAFDAALITNITSEHLDFHGTRDRYTEAKALLLTALSAREGKTSEPYAAINVDDEGSAALIPRSPARVFSFGMSEGAAVRGRDVQAGADGSTFTVQIEGRGYSIVTPLPGMFNVSNCLGVLALVYGRGLDVARAGEALATFAGVPGRMRRIDLGQPFTVIVDYAHTADSLQKVLQTVRPLTRERVLVVFGSAGDRDREKRPIMGSVAARFADYAVFTDEDPRFEPSDAILAQIASGAQRQGWRESSDYCCIPDRRQAILHALRQARPGDVVILAGKGHEQSILAHGMSLPWDEESAARRALQSLGY